MPEYTGSNGVTKIIPDYPGNSFRAACINRAYRRGEFYWHQGPMGWVAIFTCHFCHQECFSNGVEGDHNIMQAQGGADALWNLNLSCTTCNKGWAARMGGPSQNTRGAHERARANQIGH